MQNGLQTNTTDMGNNFKNVHNITKDLPGNTLKENNMCAKSKPVNRHEVSDIFRLNK